MEGDDAELRRRLGNRVHELGNVLTALFGTVDVLGMASDELPESLRADVARLVTLTRRAGELNADLLELARPREQAGVGETSAGRGSTARPGSATGHSPATGHETAREAS